MGTLCALNTIAQPDGSLEKVFQNPDSVQLGTFWYWISNNISEEGVAEDIRAMKRAGVNLAFLSNVGGSTWYNKNYPVGPVQFMSEEWWRVVHTALHTATEEGVEMGLFNCAGWSQSGGPWITPEQSMKILMATEAHVKLSVKGRNNNLMLLRVPKPSELSPEQTKNVLKEVAGEALYTDRHIDYFEDVCVLAFPIDDALVDTMFVAPTFRNLAKQGIGVMNQQLFEQRKLPAISKTSIVDLTDNMSKDDTIDLTSLINSPLHLKGKSEEETHWVILRIGMTTTGVMNSPAVAEATGLEVDKMNSRHVRRHFDAYIGEILRRIPARDRACLKYAVLDSYEKGGQNFTDGMTEKFSARYRYDMKKWLPTYFGWPVDSREASMNFLSQVRRYIADEIATEYVGGFRDVAHENGLRTWIENYGHGGFSGEALQYGKLSDEVAGEFWGTGHTDEKRMAASCAHLFGKPLVWAESFTSDHRSHGKTYTRNPQNLKVCADLAFTQGINATILHVFIQQYLNEDYPGVDGWFGTELNRKNTYWPMMDLFTQYLKRCGWMLRQGRSVNDIAYYYGDGVPMMHPRRMPAPPAGFDFDDVNTDVLMHDLSVSRDGHLVTPSGCEYRALVLRDNQDPHDSIRIRIDELRRIGACIIKGGSTEELSSALGVPDCQIHGGVKIEYCHRTLEDGREIYFLSNQKDSLQQFDTEFRVSGLTPERWNPVTGEINAITNWSTTDDETTIIPIILHPYESAFIVFTGEQDIAKSTNNGEAAALSAATAPWTLTFASDTIHRGPSTPITLTTLADLSKSNIDSIRYYSGTVTYTTTFHIRKLPKGQQFLDLGNVQKMAKVWLNGEYAGGAWTAPFRIPLPDGLLRKGSNELRIEVAGTWWNRLVGDSRLPEAERRLTPVTNQASPTSPLQSYGLLGPVQIYTLQ